MTSSSNMLIGQTIIHFESIDSTNDHALELIAKSNPIEGTVISADFQQAGRGQRSHKWQSAAKMNLLLSIILYPRIIAADKQFYLSMMVANAIISVLKTVLDPEKLSIKWPNDIYFEDKKLGGILIQNNLKGKTIDSSVIGIGLNVNQTAFDPQLPNPGSIASESGIVQKIEEIKNSLFIKLEEEYDKLKKGWFTNLKKGYESVLYKRGMSSKINCTSELVEGVILGVEGDGRIIVNVDGKLRKFSH